MTDPSLVVDGLVVELGERRLLADISFELEPGTVTVVIGENGAGKTTLLDQMAGLGPEPLAGQVRLGEVSVRGLKAPERARLIASLGQGDVLVESLTALARIGQGLCPERGWSDLLDERGEARAQKAAEALDVGHLLDRDLAQLSGGERRRVHVARAIVHTAARVLLCDEPHAGVDVRHRERVSNALRRRAENGATVVLSAHDLDVAAAMADRVIGLRHGRIVVDGPPKSALTREGLRRVYEAELELVDDGERLGVVARPSSSAPAPDEAAPPAVEAG